MTTAPIIVSARFAPADQAWLDGLRRAHFPAGRNYLDAHLTLFHHLAPSLERELRARLTELARMPAPQCEATGLMNLGRGVAIRMASPQLAEMRNELAAAFGDMLVPQDAAGWRPHVTIQNKVEPATARALLAEMEPVFAPRSVCLAAVACWWYRGGPWELIASYPFRG